MSRKPSSKGYEVFFYERTAPPGFIKSSRYSPEPMFWAKSNQKGPYTLEGAKKAAESYVRGLEEKRGYRDGFRVGLREGISAFVVPWYRLTGEDFKAVSLDPIAYRVWEFHSLGRVALAWVNRRPYREWQRAAKERGIPATGTHEELADRVLRDREEGGFRAETVRRALHLEEVAKLAHDKGWKVRWDEEGALGHAILRLSKGSGKGLQRITIEGGSWSGGFWSPKGGFRLTVHGKGDPHFVKRRDVTRTVPTGQLLSEVRQVLVEKKSRKNPPSKRKSSRHPAERYMTGPEFEKYFRENYLPWVVQDEDQYSLGARFPIDAALRRRTWDEAVAHAVKNGRLPNLTYLKVPPKSLFGGEREQERRVWIHKEHERWVESGKPNFWEVTLSNGDRVVLQTAGDGWWNGVWVPSSRKEIARALQPTPDHEREGWEGDNEDIWVILGNAYDNSFPSVWNPNYRAGAPAATSRNNPSHKGSQMRRRRAGVYELNGHLLVKERVLSNGRKVQRWGVYSLTKDGKKGRHSGPHFRTLADAKAYVAPRGYGGIYGPARSQRRSNRTLGY